VLLCGNAYLGDVEPRISNKIMPIANHVLATEPLGEERARELIRDDCCVCATKFVVDYYRFSADHRLLFGGGETYSGREPGDVKSFVRKYMLRVFPQLADTRIDYAWGGRLAITLNRLPQFGRLGADTYFAQGFSGHGVALTSLAGKLIAEAVAGTAERFDMFARVRHRTFPGGTLLRKPALVLGMLYYSLKDRL
jgi:gamma-glutamylputrescine oxidase